MKLKNVLVVYKKSAFDLYAREKKDAQFIRLLKKKSSFAHRFIRSDKLHQDSMQMVRKVLKKRELHAVYSYRPHPFNEKNFDLILTVGGDGTFLETSHQVNRVPMLGINSSPKDSVGMFCGISADLLDSALTAIEQNKLAKISLTRLGLKIGKKQISIPVLNDVLISHANPATTSRYQIQYKGYIEEQKSSGIWVAPPAGSTAAICGAGGKILPMESKSFQFVVRELYKNPGWKNKLQKGILKKGQKLKVRSKMRKGKIFLDGSHVAVHFLMGETVEISTNAPPLQVYGYNLKRRELFR